MPIARTPPAALFATAAAAQWVIARRSKKTGIWGKAAAVGVGAGALGMLGGSLVRFRHEETTVDPVHPQKASSLVTDGPNRFTRNPMYVGMGFLLVAHSIFRGSVLSTLPAVGFIAVIDRLQISAEEDALGKQFGEHFEQYCAAVPRWLDRRSWPLLMNRSSSTR